jgi:hypothetical protein
VVIVHKLVRAPVWREYPSILRIMHEAYRRYAFWKRILLWNAPVLRAVSRFVVEMPGIGGR